jgi:hypothetical protein
VIRLHLTGVPPASRIIISKAIVVPGKFLDRTILAVLVFAFIFPE